MGRMVHSRGALRVAARTAQILEKIIKGRSGGEIVQRSAGDRLHFPESGVEITT